MLLFNIIFLITFSVKKLRHEHGKRILFELKDIPTNDSHMITSAEIHLYKSATFNISNAKIYTITLYQVLITKSGYVIIVPLIIIIIYNLFIYLFIAKKN